MERGPLERLGGLVAVSARMRATFRALRSAAPEDSPLLLLGETGTGKELAAKAVHALSRRPDAPLVVVDCHHPSPAPTVLRHAHGGNTFLDDVCALPLPLQAQLAAELDMGQRALALFSAQRPPSLLVERGLLLPALARHLEARCIELPPLRQRPEDLPALLLDLGRQEGLVRAWNRGELEALARYPWPGNVRELRNVVLRAALGLALLPPPPWPDAPTSLDLDLTYARARSRALARFEEAYLRRLLLEVGLDAARACARSGLSTPSLYRLLKKNELQIRRLKNAPPLDKGAPSLEEEP